MEKQLAPSFEKESFKLAVEQSREGFAIHDNQAIFTYINPAMASMYGFDADQLIGKSWRILYPEDQVNKIETEYLPILLKDGHWHGSLQGRKKNGELFDVDVSLTALKDGQGKLAGIVCQTQDRSEVQQVRTELIQQKKEHQLLLDHAPVLIAHVGSDSYYKVVNKEYCEWTGISPQILGKHVKEVMTDAAYEFAKPHIEKALSGEEVNFEVKVPHASGQLKWLNATYAPNKDSEGNVNGFYAFLIDIDKRKKDELERQNIMNAIENGIEGFSLHDVNGDFTFVNPAEANMFGYQPEELIGRSWKLLYDKEQVKDILDIYFPYLLEKGNWRGELKGLKKNGDYFDVEISLNLVLDEEGNNGGLFCSCRDISERKRSQEQVDYLAYHDSLTNLPNRLLFKERLEQAIIRAQRRGKMIAVLFIDLDYFKHVNDTLGHSVGDQLLQSVSTKLKSVFRDEDTISRLGGDEFTVLLSDITDKDSVETVIGKLLNIFCDPVVIDNYELHQSISVGVSLYPQDGKDVETLMKNADTAMYSVKEHGRQNYLFYTPSLTENAHENMLYRGQLQNALNKDEFELHYQPLISITKNKVIGFEALIRWQHPSLGLVYPDKFIRFAEETNLIIPIGYQVIEKVCQQLAEWKSMGISVEYIAVNVSGVQLQSDFADTVANILNRNNTAPDSLDIEITETFLMKGLKQPVEQLEKLRENGINLSIDDFGVGYSSLSQLKQLPIDYLKIDRSFIGDIVDDPDDLAIVEAIIAMSKTLKLDITAEGVETAEQYALLQKLGCHKAQGYHFSKPVPASKAPEVYKKVNDYLDTLKNNT